MLLDPMQARQLCMDVCMMAAGHGCTQAPFCPEQCDDWVFDARIECLDEFAALWACKKEYYNMGLCGVSCKSKAATVDECLMQYGCWQPPGTCDYTLGTGPNGEDVCNCGETCVQVPYEMKCLISNGQSVCDCYANDNFVGSCVLEKEWCTYRVEQSCCNQFYGL